MASVTKTDRSSMWLSSIKVWKASSSEPNGGKWIWTQKSTGIRTSEPEHLAKSVADQLQIAAFAAAPAHVRPKDSEVLSPEFYRSLAGPCLRDGWRR